MRVLEENWQKAEAEVKSLDSLFDQCVKVRYMTNPKMLE